MSRKRVGLLAALVVAIAAATAGIAIASGAGDGDESLRGPAADRASSAALEATGGGAVLEVERGDGGGSAYEVEVRKADGTVVEIHLDAGYRVVDEVADDDGSGEDESGDDREE